MDQFVNRAYVEFVFVDSNCSFNVCASVCIDENLGTTCELFSVVYLIANSARECRTIFNEITQTISDNNIGDLMVFIF